MNNSPSCSVAVADRIAYIKATGKCDDGNYISIDSLFVAQQTIMKRIGRLEAIETITIHVALISSANSRVSGVPILVMELLSGRFALAKLSFLVLDDVMSKEDRYTYLSTCPSKPRHGVAYRALAQPSDDGWH